MCARTKNDPNVVWKKKRDEMWLAGKIYHALLQLAGQVRRVMRVENFLRVENINPPPPKIVGYAGESHGSDPFYQYREIVKKFI